MRLFTITLLSLFLVNICVYSDVIIYPAPAGIPASPYYKVEITQQGKTVSSFVYVSEAQLPQFNKSKTTSYAIFSFAGSIELKVTKLTGGFKKCEILPSSLGLKPVIAGNAVTIQLDKPQKVAIEFDDDITNPLLIFSDSPDTDIPDPRDPNVIFFGPGVHDLDNPLVPKTGQTIYIAGGAIVNGIIQARDVTDVTVRGRGILNGRKYGHTGGRHIVFNGNKTKNILVEGITIVDSPGFMVTIGGSESIVRNVKGLGWWFNSDGVGVGENSLVEDCFLKCNDDAVKLYSSGMSVYRTTIWQMENGAPFQISWNMPNDNKGFIVKDCDVIHCDHVWDNTNTAVFDAIHGGSGHMSDYLFEDIRIENCNWRLVNILIKPNKFSKSKNLGKISNIIFRNITINTPDMLPLKRINVIQGYDESSTVSNILFENLNINGKLIKNSEEGNFELDPRTTSDIRFAVTPGNSDNITAPVKPAKASGTFIWTNPITNGLNSYGQKDFHIFKENSKWYLVATEHPNLEWGKRGVILYSSDDLKNWKEDKYLINLNSLPVNAWYRDEWVAPEIHKINGKFLLSFSCRNNISNGYGRLGIGVATADKLEGPYKVLNPDKPLAIGTNVNVFTDDDGKTYIYWDRDGRLYASTLDPVNGTLLSEPSEILGPSTLKNDYRFLDAPFVMKRNNMYYLMFSSFYGGYVIRIKYMVSDKPFGPWRFIEKNPLITFKEDEADTNLKMPWSESNSFPPPTQVVFHNQVFQGPGNKMYLAYHSSEKYSEPYLVIEPILISKDGVLSVPEHGRSGHVVNLKK